MKSIKHILTLAACLLAGFAGMAQNNVIEGTNLKIGENNTLTSDVIGVRGHAIGRHNIVESHNALAVGYGDTINELSPNSIALGTSIRVGGSSSLGMGRDVKVLGDYGLGIGRYLKATGQNESMVIGSGLLGNTLHQDLYLENNNAQSLMIGFKSTRSTLTVSPSPNDYPSGDTINKTGKIAIGDVPVPDIAAKLHIRSDYGEDASLFLEPKDKENSSTFIKLKDEDHGIEVDNEGRMKVKSMNNNQKCPILFNGLIGINIDENHLNYMNSKYSLCVRSGIITDKVAIKRYSIGWWSDYVFDPDYQLMPIQDLRDYIFTNRHLPDMPSETEVMENGIELGDMQSILLKKIEELTLYVLQQQETIEQLEQRIVDLEGK